MWPDIRQRMLPELELVSVIGCCIRKHADDVHEVA